MTDSWRRGYDRDAYHASGSFVSGYDDWYWSEIDPADSPLERAREDAELREWEQELADDRLRRDDPAQPCLPREKAA